MRSCVLGLAILVLFAGCVPSPKAHVDDSVMDGSTPDSVRKPSQASFDGLWSGLTEQDRSLSFFVRAGAVTSVTAAYDVEAPAVIDGMEAICYATGRLSTVFDRNPQQLVVGKHLDIGPVTTKSSEAMTVYSLRGTLDDGDADGMLELSYNGPNCNADTVTFDWSAEQVICGDGVATWPETCDDGDAERGDGCSERCQLDVMTEQEPNDRLEEAPPPFQDSVVLAGTLEGEFDSDLFAIRNTRSGTVGVRIETHGEAVGVCDSPDDDVNTVLDILDAEGEVVDSDDDGSRMPFCSLLTYALDGGQTVFARVSSKNRLPIPRYHLHIAFQQK